MKRLLICGLVCLVAVAFSGIAMAGSQDNAKIALHIGPHTTGKGAGCAAPAGNGQYGCDSSTDVPNSGLVTSAGTDSSRRSAPRRFGPSGLAIFSRICRRSSSVGRSQGSTLIVLT